MRKRIRLPVCTNILLLMLAAGLSACHYERDDETVTPNSPPPVTSSNSNPKNLASFYVDTVNDRPYKTGVVVPVKAGGDIVVQGWAVDPQNKTPVAALYIVVDDMAQFAASYGEKRLDVADFFKEGNYIQTGFTAKLLLPV